MENLSMSGLEPQPMPTFSVIIPAYNSASTLATAIDSVRAQSWPAHEIIIVDDGSTDDTREVAEAYGDAVILISQSNNGVAAARNRGAETASGDWLAFLDADDWYFADRLRWHAEWIAKAPELDFLTGDYEYRNQAGELLGTSMAAHPSGRAMLEKAAGAGQVVLEARQMESFVADHFGDTHTLSIPRKTFLKLGGYPAGFRVCEDVHLLTRLCAASQRAGVICQPMGVYLIHEASATRASPVKAQEYNVQTLLDLKLLARNFPAPVREGVATRLRHARLNLGYARIKSGKRWQALTAVLPSLFEAPGLASCRDVASILKG
jgi:GT2 family glycosyltransferase